MWGSDKLEMHMHDTCTAAAEGRHALAPAVAADGGSISAVMHVHACQLLKPITVHSLHRDSSCTSRAAVNLKRCTHNMSGAPGQDAQNTMNNPKPGDVPVAMEVDASAQAVATTPKTPAPAPQSAPTTATAPPGTVIAHAQETDAERDARIERAFIAQTENERPFDGMRSDKDYEQQFDSLHQANTEITRREHRMAMYSRLVERERSFLAKARYARDDKVRRARIENERKDALPSPTDAASESPCTSPYAPAMKDVAGHGRNKQIAPALPPPPPPPARKCPANAPGPHTAAAAGSCVVES